MNKIKIHINDLLKNTKNKEKMFTIKNEEKEVIKKKKLSDITCNFCGNQIEKGEKTCQLCGNKIDEIIEENDGDNFSYKTKKKSKTYIIILIIIIISLISYYILYPLYRFNFLDRRSVSVPSNFAESSDNIENVI